MKESNLTKTVSCQHNADAAAFIYDELNQAERENFQAHLKDCENCAAEIADFGFLRSEIQDWKSSVFDNLATPAIVIPYKEETIELKPTFAEKIRAYFNFAPLLSAGFGILLIAIVAFAWFIIYKSTGNEMTANVRENIVSPKIQTLPDTTAPENAAPKDSTNDLLAEKSKNTQTVAVSTKEKTATQPGKNVNSSNQRNNSIKNSAESNFVAEKKQMPEIKSSDKDKNLQAQKLPRLNSLPEEDESEDLRLSDLFAENGSK